MIARVLSVAAIGTGTAVGVLGAIAAPGVALGGLFCAVLFGMLTSIWFRQVASGDKAAKALAGRRGGLAVGCAIAIGWVLLTGLALLLGPVFLLLVPVIVGATLWWRRPGSAAGARPAVWPAVQERLLRVAQPPELPAPHPDPQQPVPLPGSEPVPASLSTAQLCLAWQRTYFALLDLPAGAQRADVVRLREQLLDEIERRDPAGFTRWLDTGARPGSNPGRYLAADG